MRKKLNKDELDFIKDNYARYGGKYCSEKLSKNRHTINGAAKRLGIRVSDEVLKSTRFQEKNLINIDDYIEVKSEKIAYVLGLIWTDGHVSFSNNKNKTPIVKHCCVKYDSDVCRNIFKNLHWKNFDSEKFSLNRKSSKQIWI